MNRILSVVCLLFFHAVSVCGQNAAVDSLQSILRYAIDSEQKVDILNELSSELYNYDINKGYTYSQDALELAREIGYVKGQRYALILKGFYFYGNGQYDEALNLYRQSASLERGDDDLKAYNFVMRGNVHQSRAEYDSAKIFYERAVKVLTGIHSNNYLAYAYKNLGRLYVLQWKNEEAMESFKKALGVYTVTGDTRAKADAWYSMADVSINMADYVKAQEFVDKACQVANDLNDEFLKLHCLVNRGEIQFNLGEYTDALKSLVEALDKMNNIELPELLATIYQDLGDVYEALGQNDVSLKYFLESLKIAEHIGFKYEIAKVQSSIAWIYKNQRNFTLAHDYINRSFMLRRQIADEHGIANCYNVKGLIFFDQQRYDSALSYLEKGLEIRNRIADKEGISASLFNKALVLEDLQKYQEALDLQFQALAIENVIHNKFTLGISYNSIGSLYTKLKKFNEANKYLTDAGKIAATSPAKLLRMNNYYYWSEYYEARGDVKQALAFYKRYSDLNDSVYYDLGASKLAEFQALYQVEKKDQEIRLLNQEKQLQENQISLQQSRINFQTAIIISGVAGFLLVSLLAFKTYQYNKRIEKAHREITEQKEEIQSQSEELIEANQIIADINRQLEAKIQDRTRALTQAYKELDTFFYRASHDFRRPLTTFLGLAEVAKITVKDPNAIELFEKVRFTAINLDKMLVKLQSISDVGSQELVCKEVMLKELFETVCDSFREEIQQSHITTSCEINLNGPFISYPAMVRIIIENLVENAIQFCGVQDPYVKLTAVQNGSIITIDINDNGQGIPKQYHDQVFDMYFRGSERSKGNGLGLYIVKKAVEKIQGTISFSSIKGVGSKFTIVLPNDLQKSLKFGV